MKRIKTLMLSLCIAATAFAGSETPAVIDANDLQPVAGATVFTRSGMIAGMTDADGHIAGVTAADFPLTVRSLGYRESVFDSCSSRLMLPPETYPLVEVTVTPADRPVIRSLCYVREYCSGTSGRDTIRMYSEYMVDIYTVEGGKLKGYDSYHAHPRVKAVKRYARYTNSEGLDSVARPRRGDDDDFISFMEYTSQIPASAIAETERIVAGAMTDTVPGKYSPKRIMRKTDNLFTVHDDMLCNHKNHRYSPWFFKMLGLTMEMQEWQSSWAFRLNGTQRYDIHDFLYGTFSTRILCKGKWIKKLLKTKEPVMIDGYVELYPVEISHHTIEEYKQLRDDYSPVEFTVPEGVAPLHPSVGDIVARAEQSTGR